MTRAGRRLALALSALALLSLPACSKESEGRGSDDNGEQRDALRVEPVTTLDVGPAPVASITVSGNLVAWAAGEPGGNVPNKVVLLEGGMTKEVVRTSYPNGYVPHVRLGARWAVYADLSSAEPKGDGEPQEPWRVEAVALDTGERVLVTEQSPSAREDSPAPRIEGGSVVWSTRVAGDSGESEIFAFDLSTRTKRTLARAVIGNTAVGGGKVYFDRYTEGGSDVFSVALLGSDSTEPEPEPVPEQVSRSGRASKPAASRFGVAWVEPPQGNSTTIVVVRDGESPEVLARAAGPDDPVGYNPQVCDGFVIWDPLVGLSARAFGEGAAPALLAPRETLSSEARWSCDGATVAWVSFKNPVGKVSGTVVNVARIEAGSAASQ